MSEKDLEKIDNWIAQAGKEIMLSKPGTDQSQVPLRDILSSISGKCESITGMEEFHNAAAFAANYIEEILLSGKCYTAAQIAHLSALASQLSIMRNDPSVQFLPPETETSAADAPAEPTTAKPASAPAAQPSQEDDEFTSINLESDADILREFAHEAREHLENIEQGALVLEDQPDDATTLGSIFRAFHTFKGASGFLRLAPVNRLSHELEHLLDYVRSGKLVLTPSCIDVILEGKDVLKEFLDELQSQIDLQRPVEPIRVPANDLVARVRILLENPNANPALAAPSASATAASQSPTQYETKKKVASQMMQVDTRRFDSLVELVSELVIAQSQFSQLPDLQNLRSPQLSQHLLQLNQISLELQKAAMSLRKVAIKATFQKMKRLVHDLTANVSKHIHLHMTGEDTEMDRTIVQELADPLMHMIRNAVDHGIEKPEDRIAKGKPAHGSVRLSAYHQSGKMVIEIADDGGGLNKHRILEKAVECGIVSPDAVLEDHQIYELIFTPGFSTAEKITDISGRGVGMDVVKQNIGKLRGKIEIETTPGQGTTFRIFLPLTLAIIDGHIARLGDERYIFRRSRCASRSAQRRK
jgi:two-component system chemotaxis sensor kinase CheA